LLQSPFWTLWVRILQGMFRPTPLYHQPKFNPHHWNFTTIFLQLAHKENSYLCFAQCISRCDHSWFWCYRKKNVDWKFGFWYEALELCWLLEGLG
jgi:hypothetical protein